MWRSHWLHWRKNLNRVRLGLIGCGAGGSALYGDFFQYLKNGELIACMERLVGNFCLGLLFLLGECGFSQGDMVLVRSKSWMSRKSFGWKRAFQWSVLEYVRLVRNRWQTRTLLHNSMLLNDLKWVKESVSTVHGLLLYVDWAVRNKNLNIKILAPKNLKV